MSRSILTFAAETVKTFPANPKRGAEYQSTIQNLTTQSITITVTNERIQGSNPTFSVPASGALVITAGAIGTLNEPYAGWLVTAAASTSGDVVIVEAG